MKKIIKKIIGALILLLVFEFWFISDFIEQGLIIAALSWIVALIIVFLLVLAIHFLFED